MDISMRRFISSEGERAAVLVDGSGMPLYYPALFATWHLRSRSLAANSIVNALTAIKVLYAWQNDLGIDMESQFSRGELLDEEHVRNLCDFMQRAIPSEKRGANIVSIRRQPKTIGAANHYFRLSVVADYLGFLAARLRPRGQSDGNAKLMVEMIKANRPSKPNRSASDKSEQYLDDAVIDFIAEALKPGSELNPAQDYVVQLRNMLMFMILRLTGMRRGELLNLKVSDFDFSKGTLKIVRRPDSKGDVRSHQPTAKTLERTVPVERTLMDQIHDYVLFHRSKLAGANNHGYLFVTHKVGPTHGRPLSISAFQKWIASVASIVDGSGLHAHGLRHHWNYTFSVIMDARGVTPEKEEKVRSYLMGWSATSGTAGIYNKRHIKQQAAEAVLELQNKHLQKTGDEVIGG